jgi:hypothetical protein
MLSDFSCKANDSGKNKELSQARLLAITLSEFIELPAAVCFSMQ